jgi:Na+/melibiose symporter-like transporter
MFRIANLLLGGSIIGLMLMVLPWKVFDLSTARTISTVASIAASLLSIILFIVLMTCRGNESDDAWRPLYLVLFAFITATIWVLDAHYGNESYIWTKKHVPKQTYQQSQQQGGDGGGWGWWWNTIHTTILWPR